MNPKPLRHVDLFSSAGRLEALYRDIENPIAAAVIAHPHPLDGGTLHNKVVFRAAKGFENANVATLRFNFRGAGSSQGVHDQGRGEQQDFETAVDWMRRKHPALPLFAGGFSFGSWVASQVACDRQDVLAIFLIGAPINKHDMSYLKACPKPKLFLQGSKDEFCDVGRLTRLVEESVDSESVTVGGADHFFAGQVEVVEETMKDWALRTLEEKAESG